MRGPRTIFRGELLIDGYNLLHAAGLARRTYGPGEFARTRHLFLKLLSGQLSDRERPRTTVVFDAPEQSLGPSPPAIVHGLRVIFAGGEGDADALIERLIQQNSAPRRLHVISSDHRLQRAARRRRARFFDSEVFLEKIARRRTPAERARTAEPPEKQQGLTAAGEVEAWLRAFGDVGAVAEEAAPTLLPPPKVGGDASKRPPADNFPDRGHPPLPADQTELSFWERRIAQLWQQTQDQGAAKPE